MTDGNLPAAKDKLAREESICANVFKRLNDRRWNDMKK